MRVGHGPECLGKNPCTPPQDLAGFLNHRFLFVYDKTCAFLKVDSTGKMRKLGEGHNPQKHHPKGAKGKTLARSHTASWRRNRCYSKHGPSPGRDPASACASGRRKGCGLCVTVNGWTEGGLNGMDSCSHKWVQPLTRWPEERVDVGGVHVDMCCTLLGHFSWAQSQYVSVRQSFVSKWEIPVLLELLPHVSCVGTNSYIENKCPSRTGCT